MLRRVLAGAGLAAIVLAVSWTAMAVSAPPSTGGLDVCDLPSPSSLASVNISSKGVCIPANLPTRTIPTPAGSIRLVTHRGEWGSALRTPAHALTVNVTRIQAPGAVLSTYSAQIRQQILVPGSKQISLGSVASILGSTSSCNNPGTDDCTIIQLQAIVHGNYELAIVLADFPKGQSTSPSASDNPEDRRQEMKLFPAVIALARAVAAKF